MKRAILALVLLTIGCGTTEEFVHTTEEEAFLQRLWIGIFAGTPETTPHVEWIEGGDEACDGHGQKLETGGCRNGTTLTKWYVQVWRWPGLYMEQSALAHEFAHARDMQQGGDGDPWHRTGPFQPGGDVWRGEVWLRQEREQGRMPAHLVPPPPEVIP